MKKYIAPDMEYLKYDNTEVLGVSENLTKNGKFNLEFNYQEWDDQII